MASQVASPKLKAVTPARGQKLPEESVQAAVEHSLDPVEVAVIAYRLWHERGCPAGSDQEDWFRAEAELRNQRASGDGPESA